MKSLGLDLDWGLGLGLSTWTCTWTRTWTEDSDLKALTWGLQLRSKFLGEKQTDSVSQIPNSSCGAVGDTRGTRVGPGGRFWKLAVKKCKEKNYLILLISSSLVKNQQWALKKERRRKSVKWGLTMASNTTGVSAEDIPLNRRTILRSFLFASSQCK